MPWDVAHGGLPTATGVAPVDDSPDNRPGSGSREHADIHNEEISLQKPGSVHTNPTSLCLEQAPDAEYFNADRPPHTPSRPPDAQQETTLTMVFGAG